MADPKRTRNPSKKSARMTAPRITDLSADDRLRLAERWNAAPAMRSLGARADFGDPAAVRVRIAELKPFHRGGLGTEAVNGAVIAGLCDAAVGFVGHLQAPGHRVGTAQLSIQFLRPVLGESVTAVGRLVRAGRNLVFAAVEIENGEGHLCARGDGIVAIVGEASGDADVAL